MERKRNRYLIKLIATALAVILLAPVHAYAAAPETVSPMASAYLASYTAAIHPAGNGELQVWFRVTGTGTQDYLGSLAVYLYESTDNENWSWVETYFHEDNDTMLAQNTYVHMGHVTYYEGIPGRYYKAYVCIWGGPGDTGDARYIWTPVVTCT